MENVLNTKFGRAKIRDDGYYRITTVKEGNHGKLLHRLIWEDFYGCEVPKGYVIHHRNHIKIDNCILNLQLMRRSDHLKLHKTGVHRSDETKQKISESKTGVPLLDETKQKISESQKNKYATIIKKGFNKNGKQSYALKFKGKILKLSINPNKLLEYFLKNYPLEIIKIPEWLKEEL